ncbi:hypothetical protein, conserved in T. vivax [Trypanosoma vivax Y486]|uniref:Uncharacterized protein n=1 Tax=Trypanosoma vivax (strain Y486) TaxID=1055687 RepID=F9WL76_TRYVY|nr:hypothetical protein, conserved in T. vivax [Trypanosoma vivax Y486]|eukprot:CCD18263.1 hypothetical protein, conserved in T. vivax [Trypanosoma vivax Y486]
MTRASVRRRPSWPVAMRWPRRAREGRKMSHCFTLHDARRRLQRESGAADLDRCAAFGARRAARVGQSFAAMADARTASFLTAASRRWAGVSSLSTSFARPPIPAAVPPLSLVSGPTQSTLLRNTGACKRPRGELGGVTTRLCQELASHNWETKHDSRSACTSACARRQRRGVHGSGASGGHRRESARHTPGPMQAVGSATRAPLLLPRPAARCGKRRPSVVGQSLCLDSKETAPAAGEVRGQPRERTLREAPWE